jgi:hypothetical protein
MSTRFVVEYRVSNTEGWRVWGIYPSLCDATTARKAMPWTLPALAGATTHGKVLGKNIRPAHEWE